MVFRSGNALMVTLLAALVLAPAASAWAWPVEGPVLRPFVSDGDPYSGGQHRGIDIGAPTASDVRSATTGVVAYAGQLPRQGLCLTIRTEDGWSVTLVHLGSIGVTVGTRVSEGDVVGTIGPSGEPEGTEPYVHLGIRHTADANGYVDPLTLLPPQPAPEPAPPEPAQALAPVPPVSTSQALPGRVTPRPRHPAVVHARARHRSVGAPAPVRARASVPVRTTPKPAPHTARPRARLEASRTPPAPVQHPRVRTAAPGRSRAREQHERLSAPVARVSAEPPVASVGRLRAGHSRRLLILLGAAGLALVALGVIGWRRRRPVVARGFAQPALRKMSETEPAPEERLPEPSPTAHSRRRRVALREWPAASGACRRLRRPVGHHGPLSPAAGRLRPDGQRHRRARHAGHGRGRSRGSVTA